MLALAPLPAAAQLAAAVLPSGRSVTVGATATAYATMINTGAVAATGCTIAPAVAIPATFFWQQTDSATNALTGAPSTPVDIPAGQARTFAFGFTPTGAFPATDVSLSFACSNTSSASVISGVNTLLLSASATPVPDLIAIAATTTNDGVAHVPSADGTGFFSTAAVNIGAADTHTVAPTVLGGAQVQASVCETNPSTAACLAAPAASVTTTFAPHVVHTFTVFLAGQGALVAPDFAGKRVRLDFRDSGAAMRGSTSVAVCTVGTAGCQIGPSIAPYRQLPGSVASTTAGHGRAVGIYDWNRDGKLDVVVTDSPINTHQLWDRVTPLYRPVLPLAWNAQSGISLLSAADISGQPIAISSGNDALIASFGSNGAKSLLISSVGPEVLWDLDGPAHWVLAKLQLITSTPQGLVLTNIAQNYPNQGQATTFPGTGWGFWHSVAVGDFNNDGWNDIAAVNGQGNFNNNNYRYAVPIFLNDKNGGFTYADLLPANAIIDLNNGQPYTTLPGVYGSGKFGGVGGADLFWGNSQEPQSSGEWTARSNRIYRNTGSGFSQNFVELPLPPPSEFPGHRYGNITVDRARVADINKDGLDDITIVYFDEVQSGEGWGQIWLQNPDHTFRELSIFANHRLPNVTGGPGNPGGDIYAVDVNGDGLLDLVLNSGVLPTLRDAEQIVWINMGHGSFKTLRELAPNTLPDVPRISSWWFANVESGPAALIAAVNDYNGGIRLETSTLYGFSAAGP
jgi:hypothetical protein